VVVTGRPGVESVLLGGGVELAPEDAAAGTRGSRRGIDLDLFQAAQVDQDPVGADAQARDAVAPDRPRRAARAAGEADRRHDVGRAAAPRDDRGSLVVHGIEDLATVLVGGIRGQDHVAGERPATVPHGVCRS
jgi:hypothetical protein